MKAKTANNLRGLRILIAEDEKNISDLLVELLSQEDREIVIVHNGMDAVRKLRETPYDLLITDHTMPAMTGMKLSEEVLRIKPELPIILCTGFSESVSEEEAFRQGIKKLIYKPLRRRDLAMTIFELLNP